MPTLYQGDCLKVMADLSDASVDMVLCDLPYGTTACKWDTVLDFNKLWEQYKRITKDSSAIVLTACQPFTSALVLSNPAMFRYEWIWEKDKATGFLDANRRPLNNFESVLVFSKTPPRYYPQMVKGKPHTSLLNSPGLRFVCEEVRAGAEGGQNRPDHEA